MSVLFEYPADQHQRRHGPDGYVSYHSFKEWLRDEFCFRCVYCLFRERWYPNGDGAFGVEHVTPRVAMRRARERYDNLVYACIRCNSYKRDVKGLIDPCTTAFGDLLHVDHHGRITSGDGRGLRLIRLLNLDADDVSDWRREMIQRYADWASTGLEPSSRLSTPFRFPAMLPDLSRLRPKRNSQPGAIEQSWFAKRRRGVLPMTY